LANRTVSIRDRIDVSIRGATGQGTNTASSDHRDAELLAMVAAHDPQALRIFHDRHAPWLLARLRRRCSNDDVVFDALQDTFVAVWRSAEAWNGEGEPAAWLWGIASRRLIGSLRARSRWAPTADVDGVDAVDPHDPIGRFVERSSLGEVIESLPGDLHAVVVATYVDDLSVSQTGRLLGLPNGTVKTRLMRARRRMRGVL
jgi:RNA polymerase sigma-70 factor (ECF subfamily)